jgi:uncharacterized protein (DUF302 family)
MRVSRHFFAAVCLALLASPASAFEYELTVTSSKTLDEAVDAVTSAAQADGLKIPGVHTLPAVGFQYVLVEVCDPEEAKRVLAVDPKLGLLLPCGKIGVYQDPRDGKRTKIAALLPSAMVRIYPSKEVLEMAESLRPRLEKILDRAK